MYAELVKDPLIVAALSAIIGVTMSLLVNHGYGSWKHWRKRKSILRVLRNQLDQHHRQQLTELESSLEMSAICEVLDPSPVLHFLNGDVITLPKDQKLVAALYNHLGNIEIIRGTVDIIGKMISAGWATTGHQTKQRKSLQQRFKDAIPRFQKDLDSCVKELPQ